ncbi:DNA-directed RNA polymerase subunit H [Candidatus Micrarchaeota archaeon]|nr:DNA-directed RNA polymerase subunit H [Candidatus Micrarchaeota archaeon]
MGTDTIKTVNNFLVPKAQKASVDDVKKLCDQFRITAQQLPRVLSSDPGVSGLSVQEGDVVKFTRKSWVTGKPEDYYRLVI